MSNEIDQNAFSRYEYKSQNKPPNCVYQIPSLFAPFPRIVPCRRRLCVKIEKFISGSRFDSFPAKAQCEFQILFEIHALIPRIPPTTSIIRTREQSEFNRATNWSERKISTAPCYSVLKVFQKYK